jgi:hypothetical protein
MAGKPAVSLAAVPGRRKATVTLAQRIEAEGFGGIYCPSLGDGLGLCEALALSTREIPFGTSIANIYTRHPHDFAQTAALVHELSGGRFRFGIGVSHGPTHAILEAGDDRVAFEWLLKGTHLTADGRRVPVTMNGCDVCRVRDGKLVELRGYFDRAALVEQLQASSAA